MYRGGIALRCASVPENATPSPGEETSGSSLPHEYEGAGNPNVWNEVSLIVR